MDTFQITQPITQTFQRVYTKFTITTQTLIPFESYLFVCLLQTDDGFQYPIQMLLKGDEYTAWNGDEYLINWINNRLISVGIIE